MMAEVSRETDRPDADVVDGIFPDKAINQYVDILLSRGVAHGLIGPREAPRIWSRHILNCAAIAPAFPAGSEVVDVGSGAGLPGLVLALARPDLRVTLVEPLLRRSDFLTSVAGDLGLVRVEVVRARAEELVGERTFDFATARAVAALARLVRWTLPLVNAGGALIAMKGSSASEEISTAAPVLREFRAGAVLIESYSLPMLETPTTVVRIESSGHLPRKAVR
jgi:16S rRNA (guanine527-N7)-methyltransferase